MSRAKKVYAYDSETLQLVKEFETATEAEKRVEFITFFDKKFYKGKTKYWKSKI